MKLLGGIIGAITGAVLVLAPSRTVRLHSDPSMISQPMVLAIATVVAMVAGAVIGGRTAARLSEADEGGTGADGLPSGFRVLRIPIPIACLLVPLTALVDAVDPRPLTGRARAKWVDELLAHYAEYPGAAPKRAKDLAYRLQGCIRNHLWFDASVLIAEPGCANLAATQFGLSPDSLAVLGAYRLSDQGWRWQVIEDSDPTRVAILPDPLLRLLGPIPVYEVMSRAMFLREALGEPAYALDSAVIKSARAHDCLVASARELRRTGQWDGDGRTLPALVLDPEHEPAENCSELHPAPSGVTWPGGTVLDWEGYELLAAPRLYYRAALGATSDTPFRVTFIRNAGMHYMVDEHGRWHVRLGGEPLMMDPPPDECLFDHDVPCFD